MSHGACHVTASNFCVGVVRPYADPPPLTSCNATNAVQVSGSPTTVDATLAIATDFAREIVLEPRRRPTTTASTTMMGAKAMIIAGSVRNNIGTPALALATPAKANIEMAVEMSLARQLGFIGANRKVDTLKNRETHLG